MAGVIEGEVVDPGKVIICEPGKAASARARLDRLGEYGGVVRESDVCPKGRIVSIDMDRIQADLDASLSPTPFMMTEPRMDLSMRLSFIYGAALTPARFPIITGG